MKYIFHRLTLTVLFLSFFVGMSAQNESAQIARFDKDFFRYLEHESKKEEQTLSKKYPDLLTAFFQIAQNTSRQSANFRVMKEYFDHPALKSIYRDEIRILSDLSQQEKVLLNAQKLVASHSLGKSLPQFAIHVSGFKENIIYLDTLISISGDKYLGKDYKAYQQFFTERERQRMEPKSIARDLLKAWIMGNKIVKADREENLISRMIYEGKILYLLSKLLPEYTKDEIGLFLASDVKQFEQNKSEIWKRLMRNNLFLTTDRMLISGFVDENPRRQPTAAKTPPQSGVMIGWEIVEQYAIQTNTSLKEVLETDTSKMLKAVRYNP